jgi:hypothetical protein
MLTVDDDEFWEDVQPLEINGLPAMQESGAWRVMVCVCVTPCRRASVSACAGACQCGSTTRLLCAALFARHAATDTRGRCACPCHTPALHAVMVVGFPTG